MGFKGYRDLMVWQAAMDLTVEVYRLTTTFPTYERYGLTSQLRRAAISIASNIAEGHGRTHRGEYLPHLSIARGSTMEVETQLTVAEYLGYTDVESLAVARERCDAICRMLTQLKRALAKKGRAGDK